MITKKEQSYVSPEVEVVNIEVEQPILTFSNEPLGERLDDLGW